MKNRVFVNLLNVIVSFVGALFVIGFAFMVMSQVFNLREHESFVILGFLSYIASMFILKNKESSDSSKYIGVIFYISSVFMLYFNVDFIDRLDENMLTIIELFIILCLQIVFYYLVKGFNYRVLASFFATFSIYMLLHFFGLIQFVIPVLLAILIFSVTKFRDIASGVSYTILLVTLPYTSSIHSRSRYIIEYNFTYIAMIAVSFLALYFALNVLKSKKLLAVNRYFIVTLIGVILGVVLFFFIPALAVTIFLVVFWFYAKNSAFIVASFFMFIFHLYRYYYILDTTLLEKSYYLLASTAAMFAFKFIIDKGFKNA